MEFNYELKDYEFEFDKWKNTSTSVMILKHVRNEKELFEVFQKTFELKETDLKDYVRIDEGFETFQKILEECKKHYEVKFFHTFYSDSHLDATAYKKENKIEMCIQSGRTFSWHDLSAILIHEHGHMIENQIFDIKYDELTCLCEARAWEKGIKYFSKLKILPRLNELRHSIIKSTSSYLSCFRESSVGYDELKYLHDFVINNR